MLSPPGLSNRKPPLHIILAPAKVVGVCHLINLHKLRKYAEYQDYTIAGEYSDEGLSGKNIQGRLEFQRMLQDIQDRKDDVDYVLVSNFHALAGMLLTF